MMKKVTFILSMALLATMTSLWAQVTAQGISLAGILDSEDPQVTVSFPNGDEIFQRSDNITITWNATDPSFGATPIGIYYSADGGLNFTPIELNVANTGAYAWIIPQEATLEGLIRIVAADSFGLAGVDESDAVFKIDGPPAEPQNLAAATSDHAINLTWDAVVEGDLDRYNVYRSTSPGVELIPANLLATVMAPLTGYTDSAVQHDSLYYYVVTALDSMNNESVASNEVSAQAYILQVTAVAFHQRTDGSKLVDVNYSFTGNPMGTYLISLFYSLDDGMSWLDCFAITGGTFGSGISPTENLTMTWDFTEDIGNIYTNSARVKIVAQEESRQSSSRR